MCNTGIGSTGNQDGSRAVWGMIYVRYNYAVAIIVCTSSCCKYNNMRTTVYK